MDFGRLFECYSSHHVAPQTVAKPFLAIFFQYGLYFNINLRCVYTRRGIKGAFTRFKVRLQDLSLHDLGPVYIVRKIVSVQA